MKEPIRDPKVLARMRTAMELYEAAEAMMRQNLRRRSPQASDAQIERHFLSWLHKESELEDLPPMFVRRPSKQHG
jgi:hypothetical protein